MKLVQFPYIYAICKSLVANYCGEGGTQQGIHCGIVSKITVDNPRVDVKIKIRLIVSSIFLYTNTP